MSRCIESGGKIEQETRLYNAAEGKTYGMRSKEQAHDYRYFPEPDLLPLVIDAKWREQIVAELPELPEARRARMVAQYGITEYDATTLTSTRALADQFEEAAGAAKNPKRVANLVQSELMGRLKAKGIEIEQSPISMKGVAMSADLVESGAISGKILKDLYDLAFERGEDFPAIYEKEKPQQITDTARDREDHRRGDRRQSQAVGAVSRRQEDGHLLLCGTGDEGVQGAGESRAGKRTAGEEAGRIARRRGVGVLRLRRRKVSDASRSG